MGIWFLHSGKSTLPRRGYLDPAITPTMAILLAVSMLILSMAGATIGWMIIPEDSMTRAACASALAIIFQTPIVLAYSNLRKRCGSRHIVASIMVSFVVFVPMAFAVTSFLHFLFVTLGIEPQTTLGHETLKQLSTSNWGKSAWVVVLCATLGAGIFEEVLYRGLILPTFSAVIGGKTVWGAIFATSIFFAVMHIGAVAPSALGGLFILSIGLCYARVKSGGVLAPIVIHILFNTMNIAIVYSTTL